MTHQNEQKHRHGISEGSSAFRDPVCGMAVGPESRHRFSHDGVEYRFCSAHCRQRFEQEPSRYVAVQRESDYEDKAASSEATYT
ncbi:MAG TPA: YHS domain-containing protein, partial [Nitrospira sp.]